MSSKLLALVLVLFLFSAVWADKNDNNAYPYYDLAPGVILGSGVSAQTDDMWDLQYSWDTMEAQTGNNGLLGIAFDGTYVWVSGRGGIGYPPSLYLFNPISGILVNTLPSATWISIRDMCFDGTYMYGGWESGLICMDIITYQVITTIPIPGGMQFQRANAYDPATDHFYCGNFGSTCYEQDRAGNLIRSWAPSPLSAIYGMAWDDDAPDGPWLWVHDQSNPSLGCNVHQFDPATLTYTGFNITLNPPGAGNSPIAGGLDYCHGLTPEHSSMLVLGQGTPDAAAAFEMYCSWFNSDVNVVLTAVNPPIQIPPGGGEFDFTVSVQNTGTVSGCFDIWVEALLPSGAMTSTLVGPTRVLLWSGDTTGGIRTQVVPASAPAGEYAYIAYAGAYPRAQWDTDTIYFEKLGEGGIGILGGWDIWGEGFTEEGMAEDYTLLKAYPNPFNARMVISYKLKAASCLKLVVYDITGREVANLYDGYLGAGEHEVVWDASDQSSGVYFVRLSVVGGQSSVRKIMLVK